MLEHHCHAENCTVDVPPRLLMCQPHWARVPVPLQRLVRGHYRPGQEQRKDPTAAYMACQRMAVASILWDEGRHGRAHDVMTEARQWAATAGESTIRECANAVRQISDRLAAGLELGA